MEWENQLIQELQWSNKISNKASKELVAQEIAGLAKDGDVIEISADAGMISICKDSCLTR